MPGLVLGRSLMGRRDEAGVAASATSAARGHEALAGFGEIEQALAGRVVVNDGAHRNWHFDRLTVVASPVAALAVSAALRLVLGVVTELKQRVLVFSPDQHDIAAVSAIPARWAAARDVLLPTERETTVAAVARFYEDSCFVEEQHRKKAAPETGRPFADREETTRRPVR